MYAATGNTARPPRSLLARVLTGPWSYRHPSLSIAARLVAGTWNLGLGIFMLSYGYWLGLLPLAGSALLLTAAFIVARDQSRPRPNGRS